MNYNALIAINNNITVRGEPIQTVNARELHEFLEIGRDFSNWIKAQIDRARLTENRDYVVFAEKGVNPLGGRPPSSYYLSLDAAKHIAMVSGSERGYEIREYFIECENAYRQLPVPSQPLDPVTQMAQSLLFANQLLEEKAAEVKQLVYERDEAIQTKAHISDKKTATAMGTASAAVRRAKKLEEKLGIAENYRQVRAISWLRDHFFVNKKGALAEIGKILARLSRKLGYEIKMIDDERYDKVGAYHRDVIEHFREKVQCDLEILPKYRIGYVLN